MAGVVCFRNTERRKESGGRSSTHAHSVGLLDHVGGLYHHFHPLTGLTAAIYTPRPLPKSIHSSAAADCKRSVSETQAKASLPLIFSKALNLFGFL